MERRRAFTGAFQILYDFFDDDDEDEIMCIADMDNVEDNALVLSLTKNSIRRLENHVEEILPTYSDHQFKAHFRMKRSTFNYILDLISPSLERRTDGHRTISAEKQLLVAIWKMATPDSYRYLDQFYNYLKVTIGLFQQNVANMLTTFCWNKHNFNIGRATALRAVRRVMTALVEMSSTFIRWPEGERVQQVTAGFSSTNGFPNVIGAIDGTHINIRAPHEHPESYVNRKKHHSIQLQAVCDHERKFTHCYVGNVGSVHDQRVFRLSEVNQYLNDPEKFPNNSHLLGDSAYTLHDHMLSPYRDNGHLTGRQKNYNYCHSSTRMTIERTFGLLKTRFRSLLTVLDMERVDLIPSFILACCVCHNICLIQDDDFPVPDYNEINHEDMPNIGRIINTGNVKRNQICNRLEMRII